MTLGQYLERIASSVKDKCKECDKERFHHAIEMYHKDGQLQVTMVPQQAHTNERDGRKPSLQGQQLMFPSRNLKKEAFNRDLNVS